jgi:hypothetical protein
MSFINITNIVIHIFNQIVLYLFDVVYFIKDILFVRPERIELSSHPWQGRVLPLNHDRKLFMYKYN